MNTVANVKKVSLLFFIALTGAHLFSALMLSQGYLEKPMQGLYHSLDLPALFAGVLYAFTSVKTTLQELGKSSQWFDILGGVVGAGIIVVSLFFNFF